LALARAWLANPATGAESKELRKQRQVAQKERQAQNNEREKNEAVQREKGDPQRLTAARSRLDCDLYK
jgi:hypothetical protein